MPRRRRKAARGAGGRGVEGAGPATAPTALKYLAAKLYGNNPRMGVGEGGKAMLKLEVAANIKEWYTRRGEREAVAGVLGAALVIEDPDEVLDFDENGRLRVRVFSPAELKRFAWRLLEFADALEVANAMGVSAEELRAAYWGDGGAAAGGRRRRRAEPEPEEEEEEADEGGFEEVEVA